jgi:hypothetical protein
MMQLTSWTGEQLFSTAQVMCLNNRCIKLLSTCVAPSGYIGYKWLDAAVAIMDR